MWNITYTLMLTCTERVHLVKIDLNALVFLIVSNSNQQLTLEIK